MFISKLTKLYWLLFFLLRRDDRHLCWFSTVWMFDCIHLLLLLLMMTITITMTSLREPVTRALMMQSSVYGVSVCICNRLCSVNEVFAVCGIHRVLIQDSAAKLWETYYENERKCVYSQTERIQSQLHSVSHITCSLRPYVTRKLFGC